MNYILINIKLLFIFLTLYFNTNNFPFDRRVREDSGMIVCLMYLRKYTENFLYKT